jgi:hypothetical protein
MYLASGKQYYIFLKFELINQPMKLYKNTILLKYHIAYKITPNLLKIWQRKYKGLTIEFMKSCSTFTFTHVLYHD